MATDITVTEDVTNVTVTESTTAIDISPQVTSVGVSAVDITAANVASSISLTPTGNISATNVQAAFNEIGANEDFTTALKDKLDGIEEGATADQTGAEIKTAYEAESDTNAFTDDEKSKLAGIEPGANVTDTANVASSGAVMDSDFTSNGFMKRTGDGSYSVDTSTYLTDYTVTESDVRAHESAIEITESQITNLQSYLTAESDPVFSAHAASGVTATKIDNWDTAYNWGDHEEAGYLTAETSHADVVVDGDFTSAGFMKRGASAGTYEIASSITFTDLDCVKDEDDMTSDSATHVPTQQSVKAFVEDRELKFFYDNDTFTQSLTTTSTTIWRSFDTPTYAEKRLHEVEFQLETSSGSSYFNNDYVIEIEAVIPNGETAFLLGEATYESNVATYVDRISFSGNVTDKITTRGGFGLNLDSSGLYEQRTLTNYYYSNADDKTYVEISRFPTAIISSGTQDLYFDPFIWDDAGENRVVLTCINEIARPSQAQIVNVKAQIGYFSQGITYRIKAKEISSTDSVSISGLRHNLTTRKI